MLTIIVCSFMVCFCKQKTSYGLRISDWSSDVCSSDLVGHDEDFFALGGYSIMAIQIVGRARAHGLALTPTQVFEAPTPRGLAQLAAPVSEVAGRDVIVEAVPLTPIQHWFMETPMRDRKSVV